MSKWFANITSLDELRNQYKKLLIKYHPDNNHNLDTTDVMQEINSEYDQLLNHFKDNHTNTQTETELKKTLNEVIKLHATNIRLNLLEHGFGFQVRLIQLRTNYANCISNSHQKEKCGIGGHALLAIMYKWIWIQLEANMVLLFIQLLMMIELL